MIWAKIKDLFTVKVDSYPIGIDDIRENLRIKNSKTIKDIYGICLELLSNETQRSSTLDTKGSSLFGIMGVTIALIFSAGGFLIDKISNISLPIISCPIPLLVMLYVLTTFFGLLGIVLVLLSIRMRTYYRVISDKSLFRKDVLEKDNNFFRRYIITHVWLVYRKNFLINERKARILQLGQFSYLVSILLLLPIILVLALYVLTKGGFIHG